MTKTFNTFRQNLFLLAGSIIFTAILAEIVLRIALPAPITWNYPQEYYVYDADIGHWLKPNQKAFTHDKIVSTNSIGIRDSEYASQAAPGVYRILALGDSQTFGNGLELADTWPKQLESSLNQAGNEVRFEVLNGGLAASDTWQHEIILQRMLAKYHPNAVVLAFYVNDVVKKPIGSMPTQLAIDNTLKSRIGYILKQSSLLLTLRTALNSIRHNLAPSDQLLQQQALLNGEDNPVLDERWKQVERSLLAMKRMCDEHQVALTIATLPRRDQVYGNIPWAAYYNHLQAITDQHQIRLISMLAPLQQAYMSHGKDLFISWDGHNSKIANSVIANAIAGTILAAEQSKQ